MLNKSTGNMFDWVTHTWNAIKGECPHGCPYCYMKRWGEQPDIRFDKSEFKTDLGSGNTIFVGSSNDVFANAIPAEWIEKTLNHCNEHTGNIYLFQTKNPVRLFQFLEKLPPNVILGTTIESDTVSLEIMGNAPSPSERHQAIKRLKGLGYKTTVTIEPVVAFTHALVEMVKSALPDWISIGANTYYKVKLSEPTAKDLRQLIDQLQSITEVKVKDNLNRLMKGSTKGE